MIHSISAPGSGAAAGIGLAAAQSGRLAGGDARLQAQAAVLAGVASGSLGVVAIVSGTSVAVMLSGALAVAAAPVGIVLSGLYLAQGGKGLQAQQYSQAMEALGVVSSVGSLLGFTAKALSGGSYQEAVAFGQGAGLVERVLTTGSPSDLGSGFEVGTLMVDGGIYVAEHAPETPRSQTAKPGQLTSRPDRSPDRGGIDRDTEGQRRAERMRADRDRDRERAPAPAPKEPLGKPGGGELRGDGRTAGKNDGGKRDGGSSKRDGGSGTGGTGKSDSIPGGNWRGPM